jgi:hypothetical protein
VNHSIRYYVGIPDSGKTTLARRHLCEAITVTGLPAIIVDSMYAGNLADIPACRTVAEVVERVWREGKHARYVPAGEADLSRLCDVVTAGKDCLLLIDEIARWASNRSMPDSLERLLRGYRHHRVSLLATTQAPVDLHQLARQCASDVYCFRIVSANAADLLEREWGFPPAALRALGRGAFLKWSRAEQFDAIPPSPPAAPPLDTIGLKV